MVFSACLMAKLAMLDSHNFLLLNGYICYIILAKFHILGLGALERLLSVFRQGGTVSSYV